MDRRTGLPVVGMVGAGQLARMTHQAAIGLGQSLRVLATDPNEAAALVASDVVVGDHTSYDDLSRFAAGCDVLTWDHEHVPGEHIRRLAAAGHVALPGAAALHYAQDKVAMHERLDELGVATAPWAVAATAAEVERFAAGHGWPVVVKAPRGGYDGRGVWTVPDRAAAGALAATVATTGPMLVEAQVPMLAELAAVVARSPFGQVAAWPVVQTVQRDGICVQVLAPAPGLDEATAIAGEKLAITLAAALDVVGVLAVELFQTGSGLLVNELAMRPHNSGHWTIEGARTNQFEQHLRAVLDYPLGDTRMTAPVVVMANVLGGRADGPAMDERVHHLMAHWPAVKLHLYGKSARPGRKIGHVTALGADLAEVREQAAAAARYLSEGERR